MTRFLERRRSVIVISTWNRQQRLFWSSGLRDYKRADEFLKKAKEALAYRESKGYPCRDVHHWECNCRAIRGTHPRSSN